MRLYRVEQSFGLVGIWKMVLETYSAPDADELFIRLKSRHERGLEPGMARIVAIDVEVIE